jgi:hypothetical protein
LEGTEIVLGIIPYSHFGDEPAFGCKGKGIGEDLEEGMDSPEGALFVVRGKFYFSGIYLNCVFLFSFDFPRVYIKGYEGFPFIRDGIGSEEIFELVGEEVSGTPEASWSGNFKGKLEDMFLVEDGDLARRREDRGILRTGEGTHKGKKHSENSHSE